MAEPQQIQTQLDMLLADLNVKLRDIEEKQNLIKDRILLIGENLISEKQETEDEVSGLKARIKDVEDEIKKIKLAIQRLLDSQENLARKSDVEILWRQFKMFQPLEFARLSDVKAIVNKALEGR